ncbi:MAG TPA: hypothetical protein VKA14_05475 [Gammaproteobacteria bacterium]|nr:hypothetical protein [Gammaproteobacteria bacterium]
MTSDKSLITMVFATDQPNVLRVLTVGALFGATVTLLQNVDGALVAGGALSGALVWGGVWKVARAAHR